MKNFKHVKFSRRTARQNPGMIIREYETIISKIERELSKRQNYTIINMNYCSELENFILENKDNRHKYGGHPSSPIFNYKISFEQIVKIYNRAIRDNKEYIVALEFLESVKQELSQFRLNYQKTKYYGF